MTNVLTRIRLKSALPLPEFRIWFAIPQNVESIKELKSLIHKSVISLKKSDFQPSHLTLELEDYELPDESPIGLLRESDVILIKRCITRVSPKKRKQPIPTSSPQRKKRRLSTSSKSSSTSTSLEGSSSTADSNTSSTSASNSEVSGSFGSESSSDADSSVKPTPIKKFKSVPYYVETTKKTCSDISKTPIPPGMGKSSTHSRNRRRKIKRWKQKTQNIIQNTNESQQGQGQNNHQAIKESLMHDHLPFFPPHIGTLEHDVPSKAHDNLSHPFASFIPPSERRDLPSNIFVTSIDVEDVDYWKDHSACEENVQLEEISHGTILDWDTIDGNWDTYPNITSSTTISKGNIVGWRAFGLNPSTLTPDVSLLHLGRVLEIGISGIRIVILSRGVASFGGVILEEESEKEITRKREDIILENWRLIDRS